MSIRLVVTAGDPRGIGPEIVGPALTRFVHEKGVAACDLLVLSACPLEGVPASIEVEVLPGFSGDEASAGRLSALQIQRGVQTCLATEAHAIVTGPVSKPALQAGGWPVAGQTEMLQSLSAASEVGMLMAAEQTKLGGPLRVLLATRHIALRQVASAVNTDLLVNQARLLARELKTGWGIAQPRVALCALNPHASDGGLFGDEEARVFEPAVRRLLDAGVHATGPVPADTVFVRALAGAFDAVVAPYHDVGMAAFKTASFGGGVNVTLGLPFVRTSPDHGTAFDIAGKGIADPSSMVQALTLAHSVASNRALH